MIYIIAVLSIALVLLAVSVWRLRQYVNDMNEELYRLNSDWTMFNTARVAAAQPTEPKPGM